MLAAAPLVGIGLGLAIFGTGVAAGLTAIGGIMQADASKEANTASLITTAAGSSDSVHIATSLHNGAPTVSVMGGGTHNTFSAWNSGFLTIMNSVATHY